MLTGNQNSTSTIEGSLVFSYKSNFILTIGPNSYIPLYLAQGTENLCSHKTYTCIFTTAFFFAKTWKQPRCPSVDDE